MSDQRDAWEKWYLSNPTSWKGSPLPLPDLPKGTRVLDVGCGTGSTIMQALEMGYDAVGIDLSETAVNRAKERISARGHDAILLSGNIFDTDLEIGSFDCILLHHVLDNMEMEERKKMVHRAMELLKEGGILSFQDLSTNDVRFGKGVEVEKNTFLKGDGIRLHFFDLEETRGLFSEMEVLELEEKQWAHGQGTRKLKRSRIRGIFQLPSFSTRGSTSGA